MQVKIFTIPALNAEPFEAEMNQFLRSHKIVNVEHHFAVNANGGGAYWYFYIKYIATTRAAASTETKEKVDYKNILDEATFKKFSDLRVLRKQIAAEEVIPPYMVFTDEELAGLAKMKEITRKEMLGIKGIGDKKVERFGEKFINALNNIS